MFLLVSELPQSCLQNKSFWGTLSLARCPRSSIDCSNPAIDYRSSNESLRTIFFFNTAHVSDMGAKCMNVQAIFLLRALFSLTENHLAGLQHLPDSHLPSRHLCTVQEESDAEDPALVTPGLASQVVDVQQLKFASCWPLLRVGHIRFPLTRMLLLPEGTCSSAAAPMTHRH